MADQESSLEGTTDPRLRAAEEAATAGDLDRACRLLEGHLAGHPRSVRGWMDLGVVRFHQGRHVEALEALERARRLDPGHPGLAANLEAVRDQVEKRPEDGAAARGDAPPRLAAGQPVTGDDRPGDAAAGPGPAPRITALVSTYASEAFMRECLDDLEAQTVADRLEIIVVDAASPEDEGRIVREYQQRYDNIRYLRTPERIGIYAAWNLAIREARGEYLISCSTNDRLRPDACERLMEVLDEDPEVALVYGNAYLTRVPHETFERNSCYATYTWPEYRFEEHLERCMVGPHPLWRRSLHDELGWFDESYEALGDQDFWLRVGERHRIRRITHFTTLHWVTPDSLSGRTDVSAEETRRVQREHQARHRYRMFRRIYGLREIDGQLIAERLVARRGLETPFRLHVRAGTGQERAAMRTVESLQRQFYRRWRLTVWGSGPAPEHLPAGVVWRSGAPDAAGLLEGVGEGEWLALLEAGTVLEPHALSRIDQYLERFPAWRAVYTDDDRFDDADEPRSPRLKPDFDLDLLYGQDYLGVLFVHAGTLAGVRSAPAQGLESCAWALDIAARVGEEAVGHVDDILVHLPAGDSPGDDEAARRALVEGHLKARKIAADVMPGLLPGSLRVRYHHPGRPRVSVIVPTRDKPELLQACIDSVLEKTRYPELELIVVDNQSRDPDARAFLDGLERSGRAQVMRYDEPFNYADICNRAVAAARGEYVVLLNNDTRILQEDWIEGMLHHARRPEVGAVGVRLVFPGAGAIQHAGVVLGLDGPAGHPFMHSGKLADPGYMGRLQLDQQYSAVSAACMMTRRADYLELGGLDARQFAVSYNDIDYCLRLRQHGRRIVWTPWVTVIHHGSASRNDPRLGTREASCAHRFEAEKAAFRSRWAGAIARDPCYNRHLSLTRTDFGVSDGVACNWDPRFRDRPRVVGMPVDGGSGEYRVRAPLRALSDAGIARTEFTQTDRLHSQRLLSVEEVLRMEPDSIVMQAPLGDPHLAALADYRRHTGARIVCTLDDLLTDLPPSNPSRERVPLDARSRLRRALGHCDRLVVSTEPLREAYGDLAAEVMVVPNALDERVWGDLPIPAPRPRRRPRVGWAGAQQHGGDLAILSEVVRRTADEVEWVFFGMVPPGLGDLELETHDYRLDFGDYVKRLASLDLDLAVAPLEMHPFNEAKSNLRLLEYGYLGWPVVCTDILPYRTAPVCRVPNRPGDWIEAIRERVHDLDAARREGQALQRWVRQTSMLARRVSEWQVAYADIEPGAAEPVPVAV